jgi:hypothetical protein
MPTDFGSWILYILQHFGLSLLRGAGYDHCHRAGGHVLRLRHWLCYRRHPDKPAAEEQSALKKVVLRLVWALLYCYVEFFAGRQ